MPEQVVEQPQGNPEWEIRDFSGGLNDKFDDNLIEDNQASDCQNVIATRVGSLTKRSGQAALNAGTLGGAIQGLHSFYYGSSRKLVAAANGAVYYWDTATNAFVAIKSGLHAAAFVHFATTVNYMVAFNGVDAPWKWDGITVSALANAPVDGQFALLHMEKLFTVPTSTPSTLWWSASFEPENWPAVNYWDIGKGDGDVVTALVPYIGDLVIFKRYAIYIMQGSGLDDFRLDLIEPHIGAVGPRAAVVEGMRLYFVADDGIYAFNGVEAENLTRDRIPGLWSGINKGYLHKAVAGRWNGLLWFAVPEGTDTTNNLVLVYDPATQSWWPWRGINISCLQTYNDGTQLLLYGGSATDGFVLQQDTGYSDAGVAITSYWQGKNFDVGSTARKKKIKRAFIIDSPGANDVTVQVALDYGTMGSMTSVASDTMVRQYKYPSSARWRYMQPKFSHTAADESFEVRGFMLVYKVKRKPK